MSERRERLAQLERAYIGDPQNADFATRVGLSLSGGGYKACIFYLGSLLRLYELNLLNKIDRVSSVSGSTIAAAWLALRWKELHFGAEAGDQNFHEMIVRPLWRFALNAKIQWSAIGWGVVDPLHSTADYLEGAYRKLLFGDAKFGDLVDDTTAPRFTINATSLQLNSLWRFTRGEARNWRVGYADIRDVPLARVVAASSAFPPVFSPVKMMFAKDEMKNFDTNLPVTSDYSRKALLADGGIWGSRRS